MMVEKVPVASQEPFLSIRAGTSTSSDSERAIGGLLTRLAREVSSFIFDSFFGPSTVNIYTSTAVFGPEC